MKWPWKRSKIAPPEQRPVPVIVEQAAREILYQLAHFCRAYETCFHTDPRVHAALEGRREVWMRIRELYLDRPETEEEIRRRFLELVRSTSNDV